MKRANLQTNLETNLEAIVSNLFAKKIGEAKEEELLEALMELVKNEISHRTQSSVTSKERKLYYISAEFLLGKLLSNHLINLGIYDEVKQILEKNGKNIAAVEDAEAEPSLGNGGLGRLAACFLDSIASLGLPGDGVGLNYHLGLFRQTFQENKQKELPNPWITEHPWLRKTKLHFPVQFAGFTLESSLYDLDITGYGEQSVTNRLHLFDLDSVDEGCVEKDGICFDKTDIPKNLTLFLYPDDGDDEGKLLRIYQQYFMVSNAAQLILYESKQNGFALRDLAKHVVIQINDTHPTLVIPELVRLLLLEGIGMDEAIEIVSHTCAYTNHTILAEALEKWPLSFLEKVVPQLLPIIKELDARIRARYPDPALQIIDSKKRCHMAHLDIHYGFSVNGVAALHSEILQKVQLKAFYEIYPEKFHNKTNGITFRRWLLHCNPGLTSLLSSLIGDSFQQDATQLEQLLAYRENDKVLEQLFLLKQENKRALAAYLQETQGVILPEDAIFDIQVKRLHEYKRQQMNALYGIDQYLKIKAGRLPARPIVMIFGAKAAPAYTAAKDIIHLILCLQELFDSDPAVRPWLRIVMVENYNVTKAEKLIPACDLSEQISLASQEASGTGNMKFMLNGAVTLGTLDGANVEIHALVGDENSYIFGKKSEEILALYAAQTYAPLSLYDSDPQLQVLVDFVVSKKMMRIGDPENLGRLFKELTRKDWFMSLPDLKEYIKTKERACADYEDRRSWAQKMLINIAKAGYFSSDRSIAEYNSEIWKLRE